ncbi:MAG: M24 family metallopeptidase [Candidatus Binatia bacterium]
MAADEFHRRLDRIREGMKERGVDLLLVYGDSWRYGQLAFISHFLPKNRGAMAVIPLEAEPALLVQEPGRNNAFSKSLTWIEDVHSVGQFAKALSDAIQSRGLKPKRVGLACVEEQIGIREWNALVKVLEGAEICNCGEILTSLRLVKLPSEAAFLRETGGILAQALSLLERELKVGQKEHEIFAYLDREARRRGVEDFRFLVARSSEPQVGLRPANHEPIKKGEGLLVLVAASYQRYWAELARTYYFGSPQAAFTRNYDLASKLFHRLAEGVKPGEDPKVVNDRLGKVPKAVSDSLQAYELGNGIGLELYEEPFLGKDGRFQITEGMVLTLRVCLQGGEDGSALISEPFRVTSSGMEALVEQGRDLICIKTP